MIDQTIRRNISLCHSRLGCFNSEDALRTLRLAREMGGWKLVKLEVLGDKKTLYPNMIETIKSTKTLVREGFKVMVYCTDDPLLAKKLEDNGASAIMPLASPIGSGLGLQNKVNMQWNVTGQHRSCTVAAINKCVRHCKHLAVKIIENWPQPNP